MDNASDKKPLIVMSQGSSESSPSKETMTKEYKDQTQSQVTQLTTTERAAPAAGGSGTSTRSQERSEQKQGTRIIRPTAQARPFSTRTKGVFWIFTILHLILLLTILAAISFGLLQYVFAQTRNGPLYWGQGSFLGGVPAIIYEPVQAEEKGLIKFCPNRTGSFDKYTKRLREVTALPKDKVESCSSTTRKNVWFGNRTASFCALNSSVSLPPEDPICDLTNSSSHAGYDTATPCIVVRLTKILGFFPTSNHQEQTERRPTEADDSCLEMIPIVCEGTNSAGSVNMLVGPGLPFCAFPFWSQKGYMPPYVMVRPEMPLPVGETTISCSPDLHTMKTLTNGRDNRVTIRIEIEAGETENGQSAATLPPHLIVNATTTTTTTTTAAPETSAAPETPAATTLQPTSLPPVETTQKTEPDSTPSPTTPQTP